MSAQDHDVALDEQRQDEPLLPRTDAPQQDDQGILLASSQPITTLVLYFMALHFTIAFCEMVLVAPLVKIFERSLCLKHFDFPQAGVEDAWCNIPEIQQPLARIRGWKSMFDTIPVFLVAIPLGNLADQYGRRKIMACSLVGVALSLVEIFVVCAFPSIFPLQLVWLSSIFLLCGGGLYSTAAYMWSMASESIPPARRSHAFYYIFSAFYLAELVASFLASKTIDISPWIPCGMALVSAFVGLLLLWAIPAPHRKEAEFVYIPEPPIPEAGEIVTKGSLVADIRSSLSRRNVLFAIPVFLVGTLRYTTLNVLIQYSWVRFQLPISQGASYYAETAIVNIFLFLFFIPRITAYIRIKYSIAPKIIDLFLVRTSVTLLCLGSLSIGLAPSSRLIPVGVAVFAGGFGSRVSTLALISHFIPDSSKATLYATIAVLENMGHAVGDPSMQQIFAASLALPSIWHALAFFVAAMLYFLAGCSTIMIQLDDDLVVVSEEEVFENLLVQ